MFVYLHIETWCTVHTTLNSLSDTVEKEDRYAHKRNNEEHLRNHICCGKTIGITFTESVFLASDILHAKHMRLVIFISVSCPDLPIFPHYLKKRHYFKENVIEHKMCVLIFSTTFVWNIPYSLKELRDILWEVYIVLRIKCSLFSQDFNETWTSLTNFS